MPKGVTIPRTPVRGIFLLYKKLLVSYKVNKIYSARPVAHWMCARAMAIRKLRAKGTIFLSDQKIFAKTCNKTIDKLLVMCYITSAG